MWVLTESGELVNLEQVTHIEANAVGVWATVTTEHETVDSGRCLCKCTDEEHGRWVIVELAHHMHDANNAGDVVITMHDVKRRLRSEL